MNWKRKTLERICLMALPLAVLLLSSGSLVSQEIAPSVIASAGGSATAAEVTVSWTLGEVAVTTLQSVSGYITQGFHQPPEGTTGVPVSVTTQFPTSLYPNPANSEFFVSLPESMVARSAMIEVISLTGQTLISTESQILSGRAGLDVSNLPVGTYMVRTLVGDAVSVSPLSVVR